MSDGRVGAKQGDVEPPEFDPGVLVAAMASHRSALLTAPSPYIVFAMTGETIMLNGAFSDATGFALSDLPDIRTCLQALRRVPENDLDIVLQGWLRSQDKASTKEMTVWTAWNEMRVWIIHTSDPVLWPDGRTAIVQWIFDVTEQRRLEEELRRSQEEMRIRLAELEALYSSSPLGLAMIDPDLRFVRVNDALAEINGVPAQDHVGRAMAEVVPDLRAQAEPLMREVLSSGQPLRDIAFRGETASAPGVVRDWVEHLYPLRGARGETIGIGVICEEVTARKRVESELASTNIALRRTLDLLFLALRTAGVSVFTQDRDLRYMWVGGGYFGADPEQAVGMADADLLPAELVGPMLALKRRVLRDMAPASADMPYQENGKTRWCNVHIEPWSKNDGSVQSILGAVSDVTDRKNTEQHVRTLLSELAHRSKNLLTVIQVMARRSVSPGVPSTAFVDSFIERLSGLAQSHDLLAREDWRGISMHELVTSQIGHLRTDVSDRLVVEGPDLVLTPVAAQNLGMAIHELSTNAVKYGALSTAAGRVRISWSVEPDEEGRGRLRLGWVERGGPPVREPSRRGFGRFVIEAIAARALSGTVDLRFEPEGVTCVIEGSADASVLADPRTSLARTV